MDFYYDFSYHDKLVVYSFIADFNNCLFNKFRVENRVRLNFISGGLMIYRGVKVQPFCTNDIFVETKGI